MTVQRYSIYPVDYKTAQMLPGNNIVHTTALKIAFADLDEDQVAKLRMAGFSVKSVNKDSFKTQQIITPEPQTPGKAIYTAADLLNLVGAEDLRNITAPPAYGENMTIAMLDTGIRKTHENITHIVMEQDFTGIGNCNDQFNHGTGVASIIKIVAPECNILNFRILDSVGSGSEEAVVLALETILAMKAAKHEYTPTVVNISAGAPDDNDPNDIIRVACRAVIAQGIYIGAACGNGGPSANTIYKPACEQYVAAVGSIQEDDFLPSGFSSRGPTLAGLVKPDTVWFGENIQMASNSSDTATTVKSGTSFSTPFLTSIMLLTAENIIRKVSYPGGVPKGLDPNITELVTPQQLLDYWLPRVTVKASEDYVSGKDNQVGWGLPFGELISKQASSSMGLLNMSSMIGPLMAMVMMVPMMKMLGGNDSRGSGKGNISRDELMYANATSNKARNAARANEQRRIQDKINLLNKRLESI